MKITDFKTRVTKEQSHAHIPVELIQVPTDKQFWQFNKPSKVPSSIAVNIPIVVNGSIQYKEAYLNKEIELLTSFVIEKTSHHRYTPGKKKEVTEFPSVLTSGVRVYDNMQDIISQFGTDTNICKVIIPKGTHYMVSDGYMIPMKLIPKKIIR